MTRGENRITGLTVEGFKSIRDRQSIELKPLTVLAGANSSGKSSIMQPLLLLKQTLESAGDPGAIQLSGDHVQFSAAEQLLSHPAESVSNQEKGFRVGMELASRESLFLRFDRAEKMGFDVVEMQYSSSEDSIEVHPGMSHEAIMEALHEPWKQMYSDMSKDIENLRWFVVRNQCFLGFELRRTGEGRKVRFVPGNISPSASFAPFIQGVIHLAGLRGNPRRTYPRTAVSPRFQGTFEPYVASLIDAWQTDKDPRLERLGRSLETLGLTWKVRAKRIDDTQIQLQAGRLTQPKRGGARDMVSIADVGFGVSQSLPVVVSLIAAQPGQLVYIEQPEIHLHPLAQRRLAGVLIDAIQHGANVVIETHSSLLLRELQTAVASDKLDPDMMVLHWFSRDKDGWSQISTAEPDENGAYGDWPADFDTTELEAERAYLDAVEARGAGE